MALLNDNDMLKAGFLKGKTINALDLKVGDFVHVNRLCDTQSMYRKVTSISHTNDKGQFTIGIGDEGFIQLSIYNKVTICI